MKKISLRIKLCGLIFISLLLLSVMLSLASYIGHGSRVDQYYETKASNLTLMLSHQIDGDFMKELRELVDEEAFQNVREEAVASGDWAPVEGFLDERGMLDDFNLALQSLELIREDMKVEYVYIHSIEGPVSVYLVSAPEGISYLGYVGPNAEEFSMYTTNVHIDPDVSNMDGEWVCSAYDPIFDSQGNAVSTVGVDIDMNQVMADRRHFARQMAIISVCFTVLAVAISIYHAQKVAVTPIEELTAGAKNFTNSENGYSAESVISLNIHSGDEIETLYNETRMMQEKILDYVENITKITAEKEKISAELNVATEIQASMLPRIFPPFPDRKEFDLFASMDPAKEVGGDFYDFFLIDDCHLALVMADVSGKGVPAALFMAISKTLIKDRAQESLDPADILSNANNQLSESNDEGLFVTVWLGILDLCTGDLAFADAGHEFPVLIRKNGDVELVKPVKKKPPVATMEGIPYKTSQEKLEVGDKLFLYTDGVPEATNAQEELYGMERLEAFLKKEGSLPVDKLLPAVRADVDAFVGDAPQFDDLTMLAIEIKGFSNKEEKV